MNWTIQQHKRGNGLQEIQVSILVKEMQETWAYDSESWCSIFKERLKEIPKSNVFTAENGYKATQRNHTSVEVWKMKANGDFNYKMFTITKNDSN
ncbi:hypothetical protein [Flavobacterium branchiophilum]|uniref:Uncharacterized protein n=1 Tax=Flavobacterium branchiophilum TaxID=55197 RepID=A0A2H3KVS4_9FLAO|nr:hypothetical protein [Flavobacterium branchiophilum]PDS24670.1 hypothetical protein B0A77_07325 [Flavobacterium branchiophilum]